jgi:hypothetical protein
MTAASPEALVGFVATYQAPLRDLEIHGLALFMILGVALRMLPLVFELPPVGERRARWALALLTTAVAAEVVAFLGYRFTGNRAYAAGLVLAWAMLAAGAGLVVLPWRPWRPFPARDRSGKFVRAAFGWLGVSLAMLLFLPAYQAASGLAFSHAYYGAARHAVTVGFVSLMIMGMAAKVVPTLNGVDPRRLSGLWGPFVLVNAGCALRAVMQILTDWTPAAFAPIGVSGTLEVAGLAWWGLGLIGIIRRGMAAEPAGPAPAGPRPGRVVARHVVADVLGWFPETLDVFVAHGFAPLRDPRLTRTLARHVTVGRAASLRGVDVAGLLDALNAAIARPPGRP